MTTRREYMVTTIPSGAVLPVCPSLSDVAVTFASTALSLSYAATRPWAGASARPQGRVEATGAGYAAAALAAAAKRRGVDRDVIGAVGTTQQSKQQDQLHLMSRRDPRTWRPPV